MFFVGGPTKVFDTRCSQFDRSSSCLFTLVVATGEKALTVQGGRGQTEVKGKRLNPLTANGMVKNVNPCCRIQTFSLRQQRYVNLKLCETAYFSASYFKGAAYGCCQEIDEARHWKSTNLMKTNLEQIRCSPITSNWGIELGTGSSGTKCKTSASKEGFGHP